MTRRVLERTNRGVQDLPLRQSPERIKKYF